VCRRPFRSSAEPGRGTAFHERVQLEPADAETRLLLDRSVVLIDPVQNANGHGQHAQDTWRARGSQGVNPSDGAVVHRGAWPRPRIRHFLLRNVSRRAFWSRTLCSTGRSLPEKSRDGGIGQPSTFHDVTGWSLSYAFRVRVFVTKATVSGGTVTTRAMPCRRPWSTTARTLAATV